MLRLQMVLRQEALWVARLGGKVVVIQGRVALIIASPLQTWEERVLLLL